MGKAINFGKRNIIRVIPEEGGHGGGDPRIHSYLFKGENQDDPLHQSADVRAGAMAVLVGIAARNSIDTGKPVKIESLTSLKPRINII